MTRVLIYFSAAVCLFGQDASVRTNVTVDLNGRPVVDGPQVVVSGTKRDSETAQVTQSLNGNSVPLQKIEEHVLSEDANGRVVERIIQRYDPTGIRMYPIKERIEEEKRPDGSSRLTTVVYEGDINGGLQLQQRTVTETNKVGDTQRAETLIERPSINGSFEPVGRQSSERIKQADGYQETQTVFRKNTNGDLYPAVQVSKTHTENGGKASDNSAEYEIGPEGRLSLHSQTTQTSVKGPNGAEEVQVQIFGRNVPDQAGSYDASSLKLQEQQVIERKPAGAGVVVETLSVQRPSASDPNQLGPLQRVSETVCKGKCESDK